MRSSALFSQTHAEKFLNFDNPDVFFSPAQRTELCHIILTHTKYAPPDTKVHCLRGVSIEIWT
jgi:hypothetical protein